MQERRKRRRFAIESTLEALLHVNGSEVKGHVVDLNTIGAFIVTDLVLEKDTSLEVELCLPDMVEPLRIKAVVARRSECVRGQNGDLPAGLGLMFLTDNEKEERFIQNAVIVALERALEKARAEMAATATHG
jgi:hypothetical protein